MKEINIIIVGLGGIGNIVADALYPFLRGTVRDARLRRLVFIDKDVYEVSNVPRQKAAASMLGMNKAAAWEHIYSRSKYNNVQATFSSIREWITPATVSTCFDETVDNGPTIIMSCVDNHPARLLMSRYLQQRVETHNDLVLIQGGCSRNRATTDIFGKWNGTMVGTPIEVNHPEVLEAKNGDRNGISCEELANSSSGDQTYVENFMAGTMMMNLMFTLLTSPAALTSFIEEFYDIETHYYLCDKRRPAPPPGMRRQGAAPAAVSVDGEAPSGGAAAPATTPEFDHAVSVARDNHAAMPLLASLVVVTSGNGKSGNIAGIAEATDVGAFLMDLRRRRLEQTVISRTLNAYAKDGVALMKACVDVAAVVPDMPGRTTREKLLALASAAQGSDKASETARDMCLAEALCDEDFNKARDIYAAYATDGDFNWSLVLGDKTDDALAFEVKPKAGPAATPTDEETAPPAAEGEEHIPMPGDFGEDEDVPFIPDEECEAMSDEALANYVVAVARQARRKRQQARAAQPTT